MNQYLEALVKALILVDCMLLAVAIYPVLSRRKKS